MNETGIAMDVKWKPPADGATGLGPARLAWRRFRRNPMAAAGAIVIAAMVVTGLFAPWLAPYAYDVTFDGAQMGPSPDHWLGLDALDRDMLSRVIYGARVSLQVSVAATAVSVLLGVVIGALAGYVGGWGDELLMRLADTFSAFPGILLAIAVTAVVGAGSLTVVFIALGIVGWPGLSRIVRGQVLSLREEAFVEAARALGLGRLRITFRHILPNCLAPVIVTATVLMAGNILGEAGLGFLGIGVELPYPSWGWMLSEAQPDLLRAPWLCVAPGLAIALTVLGFNLLGDGLRDALDPRT